MAVTTSKNKFISEFNKTIFNTTASNYFSPLIDRLFPTSKWNGIKATVTSISFQREDIISLDLKPNSNFRYFVPGQYIKLKIKINGVLFSRIFSISSSIEKFEKEKTITLTIQKQKDGKVTSYIHEYLKKGNVVEISEAMGDFTLEHKVTEEVLFIAGGSGITPFRSMLYQILKLGYDATLLYYCNHKNEHIFRDELIKFNSNKIKVHLIESSQEGFISLEHLKKYCINFKNNTIFICGPAPMIDATTTILQYNDVSTEQIVIERFRPSSIRFDTPKNIKGKVIVDNLRKYAINVDGDSNILESLEKNGIFPEYGCRMGICKKCQCTKKSGVVYDKNAQNYSQDVEEKITICMSVPVGNVELEF